MCEGLRLILRYGTIVFVIIDWALVTRFCLLPLSMEESWSHYEVSSASFSRASSFHFVWTDAQLGLPVIPPHQSPPRGPPWHPDRQAQTQEEIWLPKTRLIGLILCQIGIDSGWTADWLGVAEFARRAGAPLTWAAFHIARTSCPDWYRPFTWGRT